MNLNLVAPCGKPGRRLPGRKRGLIEQHSYLVLHSRTVFLAPAPPSLLTACSPYCGDNTGKHVYGRTSNNDLTEWCARLQPSPPGSVQARRHPASRALHGARRRREQRVCGTIGQPGPFELLPHARGRPVAGSPAPGPPSVSGRFVSF